MRLAPAGLFLLGATLAATAFASDDDERRGRGRGGRVTFYQDSEFRGESFTLEAGDSIENLATERFPNGGGANDRISSIRIDGPVEVTVYRDSRFRGATLRLTRDVRNLAQGGEWNDVISSIRTARVRAGADRVEQAEVDRTIERIYRELLGRKVDPTSLRTYRVRMTEQGWTEKRIVEELRGTVEFHNVAERIVIKAYRDLLQREAEPGAIRNYTEHMLRDGWTEEQVRHSLRESQEFRDRNGGSAKR
jgi:hypothetical protein